LIQEIQNSSADTILLIGDDPWYMHYYQDVLDLMVKNGKQYFIVHPGYQNHSINSNIHILTLPLAWFANADKVSTEILTKKRSLPYGFSCLNRVMNAHRLLLGTYLWRENLIDQIIYTLSEERIPIVGHAEQLTHSRDPEGRFQSLLPIRYAEPIDQPIPMDGSVSHPAYHDAYCNIVTETSIEYFDYQDMIPAPAVTEKSFKPFVSAQIPVFFASPGHYQYFRNLGFEVMEDFIGQEFDQSFVIRKCEMICDLVRLGRDYAEDYYFSHLREIEHNRSLINNGAVEKQLFDDIDVFLSTCL
jgi:hypothetical protein